jgi:hypothetical protein
MGGRRLQEKRVDKLSGRRVKVHIEERLRLCQGVVDIMLLVCYSSRNWKQYSRYELRRRSI